MSENSKEDLHSKQAMQIVVALLENDFLAIPKAGRKGYDNKSVLKKVGKIIEVVRDELIAMEAGKNPSGDPFEWLHLN